MIVEYQENISKVTIDVREFMNETKNSVLSDEEAAKWLREFRSDLFSSFIDETFKRLGRQKSSSK